MVLAQGDERRCRELLAAALDASAAWTDHSALAAVLDACAYSAIRPPTRPNTQPRDQAELAARLLGAAHAVRGAFDESSPDAPQARAAARAALGDAAFDAAYSSAAGLTYEESLDVARAGLTAD